MEKSSAEGSVLLFVQTHEWKFKLSKTTLAAALPLLNVNCVLIEEQMVVELFPHLGPEYSCPFPPALNSYTLQKEAHDLQLTVLLTSMPQEKAGAPPLVPIPPINTNHHRFIN